LRILGDIETSKGQLYDWFSESFAAETELSQLFGRLALDQVAHRNVIQYQTRIVMRNPRIFRQLKIDFQELNGICAAIESFRQSCPNPTLDEALQATLDFEALSLALFDQEFFRGLRAHFGPFVDNIRNGIHKHSEQLRRAAGRRGGVPVRRVEPAVPAPGLDPPVAAAGVMAEAAEVVLPVHGEAQAIAHHVDRELLLMLFDALDESVFLLDRNRTVTYWNPAAQEMARCTGEELSGTHCWNEHLIQKDAEACPQCSHPCLLGAAMLTGRSHSGELHFHFQDGSRVPMAVTAHPLRNGNGEVTGAIEIFKEHPGGHGTREAVAQLEKLAFLDSLTGLANRRYLEVTLLSRLQELQRYGWRFGIIFIDVDNLKTINDTFGHAAGDLVIKTVGQTFADHARLSDVVGRWGGDEFMAVIPSLDADQLESVAEKFRALVEGMEIEDKNRALLSTISIGATAAFPEDTIETLVSRGDQLMFQSKRLGKNRVTGSGRSPAPADLSGDPMTDLQV
jgi:diguanylate cyclase (GGDEF)-like protein/PAS domain S-box-containing protein